MKDIAQKNITQKTIEKPNTENNPETKGSATQPSKITSKQIVAMSGVILLVLLYLATLILAIVDHSASGRIFILSLCCTLVVPIIVFFYSWMLARLTGKKAPGDPDLKQP